MPKQFIHIIPSPYKPGVERYFRNYENPEKYGIEVRHLTPRVYARDFGFSVRIDGKLHKGYISTRGDYIVKIPHKQETDQPVTA